MNCVYGWAGGRAGVRYVITKFSRMDSLPNFVTHGAPLRALRYESSEKINLSLRSFETGNLSAENFKNTRQRWKGT